MDRTGGFRTRCAAAAILAAAQVVAGGNGALAFPSVTVNSSSGTWTLATPTKGISGVGTSELSWGKSATPGGPQSAYRYRGAAPPAVTDIPLGTGFQLGAFTYQNEKVFSRALQGAVLSVTTDLTVFDGSGLSRDVTLTSQFTFQHEDTVNRKPCLPGSKSTCDDRVTLLVNPVTSTSFTLGDLEFFVDISSLLVGGEAATSWLTRERKSSSATLQGLVSSRPVPSLPEPGTVALVGAGLVVLAWTARRRRTSRRSPLPPEGLQESD